LPVGRKEKQIAGPLTLGAKLRHARQMANISLGEMAVSLDYTKSYLSAVENGMGRVSSELIEKYAQRLGLTVEELKGAASSALIQDQSRVNILNPAFLSAGDWRETPPIGNFYGRTEELDKLTNWITKEGCRVVGVF